MLRCFHECYYPLHILLLVAANNSMVSTALSCSRSPKLPLFPTYSRSLPVVSRSLPLSSILSRSLPLSPAFFRFLPLSLSVSLCLSLALSLSLSLSLSLTFSLVFSRSLTVSPANYHSLPPSPVLSVISCRLPFSCVLSCSSGLCFGLLCNFILDIPLRLSLFACFLSGVFSICLPLRVPVSSVVIQLVSSFILWTIITLWRI